MILLIISRNELMYIIFMMIMVVLINIVVFLVFFFVSVCLLLYLLLEGLLLFELNLLLIGLVLLLNLDEIVGCDDFILGVVFIELVLDE